MPAGIAEPGPPLPIILGLLASGGLSDILAGADQVSKIASQLGISDDPASSRKH